MIHCDDAINGNDLNLIFGGVGSDFVVVARGIKGFPVTPGTTASVAQTASLPGAVRRFTEFPQVIFRTFRWTESPGCRIVCWGLIVVGAIFVIGRDYFAHHAETLLKLAKSANDPEVAASLMEKAADVQALVDELGAALDPNTQAPDVESSTAASIC